MKRAFLGTIGLLFVATAANAQIAGLVHVWSVPGAMETAGGIGTFVACTNGSTMSNTIGVQMFGPVGTSVGTPQSITVAPNATVIFSSTNTVAGNISVD